jgi:hypothetical protein
MIHFPSKAARDHYERSLMREEITRMRFETAKLRVELGKCKDIVHGWDDASDLSWWRSAFKVLKPPDDKTQVD